MVFLKGKFVREKEALLHWYWRLKFRLFRAPLPLTTDGKIYLNLGCGQHTSGEFINVDAVPHELTHYLSDITDLSMFPSNAVDLIYASHVIEHLPRNTLNTVLKEWLRVLKPGGVLRFGVPNFDALIEVYLYSNRSVESVVGQLLGLNAPYDDHHTIWNTAYAEKLLVEAGFIDVRPWDPENAEHHLFRDKANRVFAMKNSKLSISLNLEASKPTSYDRGLSLG